MRQIGTVPDAHAARTFADYLATLKIEARLDHQGQVWALWVFDEDRVKQAKEELTEFLRNPADPRFAQRGKPSAAVRLPEPEMEEDGDETPRDTPGEVPRGADLSVLKHILTISLMAGSMTVFLYSNFGEATNPLVQAMQIAPDDDQNLAHVRGGQLWRLVTPIFIHFNFLHLLFNMLMLLELGRQVEQRRGPLHYLLLVLAIALASNLAQFYLGESVWNFSTGLSFTPSGRFGGMSGVLYGLFGYIWIKARYEPELGFEMTAGTVVMMMGWLFLCLLNVIGPVANVAHAIGLFMGLAWGFTSYVLRAVRQR